jgi:hypothetical protein
MNSADAEGTNHPKQMDEEEGKDLPESRPLEEVHEI